MAERSEAGAEHADVERHVSNEATITPTWRRGSSQTASPTPVPIASTVRRNAIVRRAMWPAVMPKRRSAKREPAGAKRG
jgi:hypothetical protein